MTRTSLSKPLARALDDNLINPSTRVFDYGCGRGDDLRHLGALGVPATGWDPAHSPDTPKHSAEVVNLGYVINVIEDTTERIRTLRDAWALCNDVLIVSARLHLEARDLLGRPHSDGVLTTAGTFQRFYTQHELITWIRDTLQAPTVAAAPGIVYVLRDPARAQTLLAERVRRTSAPPEPWVSEQLYRHYQDLLAPFLAFLTARGRLPREGELPHAESIRRRFGSLARAFAIITAVDGSKRFEHLRQRHAANLLVYLGLSLFDQRPRFTELPPDLRYDVRDFFGTYQNACRRADRLLAAAGNTDTVDLATCTAPAGKLTSTALYVHADALSRLPPVLRVLDGCARTLVGQIPEANIIKLYREQPLVTYLACPHFDRIAHPPVESTLTVNLRTLTAEHIDHGRGQDQPVLHRKEEFLAPDDPRKPRFARLTAGEERHGLYAQPETIGTLRGWEQTLAESGLSIRGHRLIGRCTGQTRFDLPISDGE